MKIETLKKYIGNTYGVLTILGLDHEEYDKTKQIKRSYFKCKSLMQFEQDFGIYFPFPNLSDLTIVIELHLLHLHLK